MTNMRSLGTLQLIIMIMLVITFVALIGVLITRFVLFFKEKKTKNYERLCYHTLEDCENCSDSTHCTQIRGEGLIKPKRGED